MMEKVLKQCLPLISFYEVDTIYQIEFVFLLLFVLWYTFVLYWDTSLRNSVNENQNR